MTDSAVTADAAAPAVVTASVPVAASEPTISLTEFCLRHSKIERSVELINGFFTIESHAGRESATEAEFVTRLAAFAAQPAV